MIRKATITVMIICGCMWGLALVTRVDSAEPEKGASAFKPVASVHSLMEGQETFFKKIDEALKNPKAPKRMNQIGVGAEVLAELANVNTRNKSEADYVQWAGELRDMAVELAGEAKKKEGANEEKLNSLFTKMKAACQACHDKYQ